MRFEFHPEALVEFETDADYYSKRQAGLELRFIDAVHDAIRQACEAPERWRVFDGEIRRILVHVFPYAVLFSVESNHIYIIAVMHCSRQPGYWKNRVV
ncbi:MAG: type II toxin-antitoxin system RelE/ParE family toxin [Verrucomicrobia bacterium]|nr:type II toxin-antitoxin system RelE/ParE family toxin [Verrucomicrobiota bacterium]